MIFSAHAPAAARLWIVGSLLAMAGAGVAAGASHTPQPRNSVAPPAKPLIVSPNNPHDFMTITAAINAAPNRGDRPIVILVHPGIYHERIIIPAGKAPISLIGENPANTIIEFSRIAYDKTAGQKPIGMWNTATAWIKQNNFAACNISFVNDGGQGGSGYNRMNGQALAIRIDGTHDIFYNCRFSSWQDTLLVNRGKTYFQNCRITGTTDFIFGAGTAYFSRCIIHCLGAGFITAAKTPGSHPFGFVFNRCRITSNTGPDRVLLGRPWGLHASVIFKHTYMPDAIKPRGWISWHHNPIDHKTTRFYEFHCRGPGAPASQRISWERSLSATQARRISARRVLSGRKKWIPQRELLNRLVATFILDYPPRFPSRSFNITRSGAIGNGKTISTRAIQKTIDQCYTSGGGRVIIPRGVFLTGPLMLASNVNLHLDRGAVLRMTSNFSRYPIRGHRYQNCITGYRCNHLAITGNGIIDGNGKKWWAAYKKSKPGGAPSQAADQLPHRPYLIYLSHCRHVIVRGVRLENSPMCNLVMGQCDDVLAEGLRITAPVHSPNTDGMDPNGRNFLITHCTFDEGDDCIAIKADGRPHLIHPSSENIIIKNCHFFHGHGLSVGSGTSGGLINVLAEKCTFDGTQAGIRLKASDANGGLVEDLYYDHLSMVGVDIPILISSYYNNTSPWVYQVPARALNDPPGVISAAAHTPRWRHIDISHLRAVQAQTAAFVVGRPESPADVTLDHVQIVAKKPMRIVNADVALHNTLIVTQNGSQVVATNSRVTRGP